MDNDNKLIEYDMHYQHITVRIYMCFYFQYQMVMC